MPTPITKTHADWLSLIEISGPFVSIPVLAETFPQGMDVVDAALAQSLKADYEFWQENRGDPAVHSAWVKLVLESLLSYSDEVLLSGQAIPAGLKAEFPEHEETLRPNFVLVEPKGTGEQKPRMLIQVFPAGQDLGKAVTGSRWAASVGTRLMELLHATEIPLGLATNGEQWMLVFAPRGETTGFASWFASLWFEERTTLNAFVSLLGARRFFGVEDNETLENLLKRSANYQQEITDQLGLQVRHAVEILIQTVDRVEQDQGQGTSDKERGKPIEPNLLYEAALTVMMRLVFLLSAEEQELLPINNPLYAEHYAVMTLREQLSKLADEQGEEVLERRFDAWSRLLATFRAVYGGVYHQDLTLPAYGGSLFNPDKYPFLEGRSVLSVVEGQGGASTTLSAERPLAIDNRTVLHLLNALQMLRVDGEMRRLSFRALDVEQIGHVYEGLLDHKAARADEVMLGLAGAKRLEPEIPLSKLEQARAGGEARLESLLKDETQKSPAALKNALLVNFQKDALKLGRLRTACGNDESLLQRVLPFAGLIRMDDFGNPAVILAGSVYVTAGTTRRATGTHYTPRSLTEPVVRHTLEPLVYAGVAEGLPREQWTLRSPAELLSLKVCDMAMGSGGFIVQVVRYLAERLVEAWGKDEGGRMKDEGEQKTSSEHSSFILHNSSLMDEDKLNYAKRLVAERCIYGVDKNPLAVEIAKLSLWLVTLAKERPFTFLDHALKCGDSLVGASEDDLLRWVHVVKDSTMSLWKDDVQGHLNIAREKRRELEGFVVRDVQDAERKEALLKEADAAMENVKRGADLLTGARLLGLNGNELEAVLENMILPFAAGELFGDIDPNKHYDASRALEAAKKERVFHWEFEFPEVFEHGGFSAFVGNPPFVGGKRIREMLGDSIREVLYILYPDSDGGADIAAFFFLRAFNLLSQKGKLGLIATNTISQGDTRHTGLETILDNKGIIYKAINNAPWPGLAAVYVNIVYISKSNHTPPYYLDGNTVSFISDFLDTEKRVSQVHALEENSNRSFIGSFINGMGFILEENNVNELLRNDPSNKDVLFPYLIGDDLNTDFRQAPSRWVINFFDWTLEKAEKYLEPMKIVREKVFPIRAKVNRDAHRKYWWQYGDKRPALYEAISNLSQVLVQSRHTKYLNPAFVSNDLVYSDALTVFPTSSYSDFCVIQSSTHEAWARERSGSIGTTLRYTPSDCFVTFPFPKNLEGLEEIGEAYHEHRRQIMQSRQEGLTSTYNRFHNPEEESGDILRLRELHVEMDRAVAAAYGWGERMNDEGGRMNEEQIQNSEFKILNLEHGFHETAQGVRFTISEAARREVLSRLLKLNHERWEEEMKNEEGRSHNEKKGKKVKKVKSNDKQMGLL